MSNETTAWPPWREVDQRWLDTQVVEWLTEVPPVSDDAAKAADALRASRAMAAVKTMCGTDPCTDEIEEAAKRIDQAASVVDIDGDTVVVLSDDVALHAFKEWCSANVTWD